MSKIFSFLCQKYSKLQGAFVGKIGRWLSSKIETYIIGIIESRIQERIQSLLYAPSGDDSPPLIEDRVLLIKIDGSGKNIVAGVLSKSQGAEPGEKKLYSRDSNGDAQAIIYLKSDGTIEINGNADFAVAFNDLKTGFDQLKTDLNTFISVFNAHVHSGVTTGGGLSAISTTLGSTSTASIDNSKVSEVKLP